MTQSNSVATLFKDLVTAWAEIPFAPKDSANPFFKNKYASMPGIIDIVRPILAKHKMAVIQPLEDIDGVTYVNTTIIHESGEWISYPVKVVVAKANDPQALGSGVTYMRRYALLALLEMAADDDDDDGNAAAAPAPVKKLVFANPEEVGYLVGLIERNVTDPEKRTKALEQLGDAHRIDKATYNKWVKRLEEVQNGKV
jgi:hypothetical protein